MAPLAFPFRIDPRTGGAAVVDPGADAEVNQEIAMHILTRPGERPLRPDLGTPAVPHGDGLDLAGVQLQLREHGHEDIRLTGVTTVETRTPGAVSTTIDWEREG